MKGIIEYLKDPELVARFQRSCGILPVDKLGSHSAGKNPQNASDQQQHTSSCSNGHTHTMTNGHTASNGKSSENGYHHIKNGYINGDSPRKRNNNITELNGVSQHVSKSQSLTQSNGVAPKTENKSTKGSFTADLITRLATKEGEVRPELQDLPKEKTYKVDNYFLHFLFTLGASCGNEVFYITFYPFWVWNIDGLVARRMCYFWSFYMYVGQATKDLVRWPRPKSPPVHRLEDRYALEYGMPSTHAMVGGGLPFSLFFLTLFRYEYSWPAALAVVTLWCALVCFSRVYLGMHTFLDVIAGLVYVFMLMPLYFSVIEAMDHWTIHHPYAPMASILLPLVACIFYPSLDTWSTARGDTTLVVGVGSGIAVGYWINYQYGWMSVETATMPFVIPPITLSVITGCILRFLVGAVIMIITRAVIKMAVYGTICTFLGINSNDLKNQQRLIVELPYKFVCYLILAIVCVTVIPTVYIMLGIERESFFHEAV